MKIQVSFLKILTFLSRLVGVLWLLAGLVIFSCSFLFEENRALNLIVGILLSGLGAAFIVVKPPSQKYFEKPHLPIHREK